MYNALILFLYSVSSLWQYLGMEERGGVTAGKAESVCVEGTGADVANDVATGKNPSCADVCSEEGPKSVLPNLAENNPGTPIEEEASRNEGGRNEGNKSLDPGKSVPTGMGPGCESGFSLVKLASMGVAFVALPKTFSGCPVKIVMRILEDIGSGARKPLM